MTQMSAFAVEINAKAQRRKIGEMDFGLGFTAMRQLLAP